MEGSHIINQQKSGMSRITFGRILIMIGTRSPQVFILHHTPSDDAEGLKIKEHLFDVKLGLRKQTVTV